MPAHLSTPLDAVSAPVTSEPIWALGLTRWMADVVITGSPSGISLKIEGSADQVNWSEMTATPTTAAWQQLGSAPTGSSFRAYPYVRVRLVSLTGGTSPTVTVTLVGVEG